MHNYFLAGAMSLLERKRPDTRKLTRASAEGVMLIFTSAGVTGGDEEEVEEGEVMLVGASPAFFRLSSLI